MSHLPVSIVGAGISGLTLGRCLLSRGIPAVIFEKCRYSVHRNNYGITLHARTYRPLLKILKIDETTFKQRVAVDAAVGGEGRLTSSEGSSDPCAFRANRGRFEQLLGEGLEIAWEHEVDSVSLASGSAPASLTLNNGENRPSLVVVGADGPHSRVRSAITMDVAAPLKVLEFATYNGKRYLTPREFDDDFASSMQDKNVLEQRVSDDTFLQISINERSNERVIISYTYSRPARDGSEDQLYRPKRSVSAAKEVPEELFAELESLRDQLQGPFRVVFGGEAMRKDRLLNWLMRSVPQQPEFEGHLGQATRGGVVLLGDAVHAEPILGGQGANVAIEDGMRLADVLANDDGQRNLLDFYNLRSKEWEQSVRESEGRLSDLHRNSRSSL